MPLSASTGGSLCVETLGAWTASLAAAVSAGHRCAGEAVGAELRQPCSSAVAASGGEERGAWSEAGREGAVPLAPKALPGLREQRRGRASCAVRCRLRALCCATSKWFRVTSV